eukprot:gene8766-714_t
MSEEEFITDEQEFNEKESLKEALELAKEKKYQEASDIFGEISEYRSVKYGEESVEVADIYYLYGDSLLSHALSSDVLFNKLNEGLEKKIENKSSTILNVENNLDDDLDTCWRCLELSRLIYLREFEKTMTPLQRKNLEQKLFLVILRIGEFLVEQDEFKEAIKEYESCLKYTNDQNDIADIHVQISMSYMYLHQNKKGIEHYEKAQEALQKKKSTLETQLKTTSEILTDLSERLIEMKEDSIIQEEKEKKEKEEEEKKKEIENSGSVNVLVPRRKEKKRKVDEIESNQQESKKSKVE